MTLDLVDDKREIRTAIENFKRALVRASNHSVVGRLGFPGPGQPIEDRIYMFKGRSLWFCPSDLDLDRYWNAFGAEPPVPRRTVPIDVEINFPKQGIDRRCGGGFATDRSTGELFLVHRGKIGGGRKGVSKTIFWDHFRGAHAVVRDGDRQTQVALIGAPGSARFLAQVAVFVDEVRRIKQLATGQQTPAKRAARTFRQEFGGSKAYDMSGSITSNCDHGLVVNRLAELVASAGRPVANDRHRDLYVTGPRARMDLLFEVKTDCGTSSLYSAVGQLMVHGRTGDVWAALVAVVPDDEITPRVRSCTAELNIEILGYSWDHNMQPRFSGLRALLQRHP